MLKGRDSTITTLTKSVHSELWFSQRHVQMWEVDHKEGWVPKNWRFQTVVPKRMLESPLDCKIECSRRGEQQRMRYFSSVQSLTRVRLFATPWISARQASVSITNSWSPLSQWCHPTISSSVTSFSSCPHSFPASGSFQMSQPLASGGQNIGVSASTSVLWWTRRTDLL